MINEQLINPQSIVVVGGSNNLQKPGGKVVKNLLDGNFPGRIYVTNRKETEVQGIESFRDPRYLPLVDLAIIAIPAESTLEIVKILTEQKNTKAFIILTAGFSEESEHGKEIEDAIVEQINKYDGALIGPNCIGVLTPEYHGVFTEPIPKLDPKGCDLISGSGATACYIMEAGIPKGLSFAKVITVGNSAQICIEDILKYMDEHFDPESKSHVKLLYLENITKPDVLLKHASSLIRKGCKIAAIKSGSSEAGSRAASSHTGALASPEVAVDALFRKAGIVRCYSREELIAVGSIFLHAPLKGKNIGIITHAGGPAVMLTDALSSGGLNVPPINGKDADELKSKLHPGSSVANPIDFLATGTADHLGTIIDYVDNKFDHIDAMVVIFGTPGLFPIFDVYELLDEKMSTTRKPIYPVLPSIKTAHKEVKHFLARKRMNFPDEVTLGNALTKVYNAPKPKAENAKIPPIDRQNIRRIIEGAEKGYIAPGKIQELLDAAGVPRVKEMVADTVDKAKKYAAEIDYPLVMKVVGPVHKSDVGGVVLNIDSDSKLESEFERMMKIDGATGVLLQPMLSGVELFIGTKNEGKFGQMIFCGLGGIFIEVIKDVSSALAPVTKDEALEMISGLKGKKILEGVRGQEGVNIDLFAEIVSKISALVEAAPEIAEMDLNPLLGKGDRIVAVDARINLS